MAPAQLIEKVSSLEEENEQLQSEVAQLREELRILRKSVFGSGKSERLDALQTRLNFIEESQVTEQEPPKQQTISYKRRRPSKRELPAERFAGLPVLQTEEIVPEEVKANPDLYQRIGEERTFEVHITPPRLWKKEIIRPKFRHRVDRSRPPVLAVAPSRAIEGGYASAQLVAFIALNKYLYHLPLYRQEKMSLQWGVRLSRKTMADWIEVVSNWFLPIYGLMKENLLKGDYLQGDETPVRVADPDSKKGKTTQGWLWVFGKPGSDVIFDWKLSRAHEHATALFKGFAGVLQSDGYQVYETVAEETGATRVACWAHVRRKFVEAEAESPAVICFVLRLIGHLYHYERQWDQAKFTGPKLRSALRASHHAQSLCLLRKAVDTLSRRARPKSKLGIACGYLIGQWDALLRHCKYGQTRLDNNLIENAIRPSAVGKKNFLFIGAPDAGKRTAIIYSIIVSCERHKIDPLAYMTDVLEKIPSMTNQRDKTSLLPSNWKEPLSVSKET